MEKNKAIEVAAPFFKAWPAIDVFYITSDAQAFFSEQDAQAHASGTRKDKIVHKVERHDVEETASAAGEKDPKGK